jgi:SSS family solute:Na+ symporter
LGGGGLSTRAHLALARLVTLAIGLLSVFFAFTVDTILEIVIIAYTYWAPVMVVPLVATVMGYPRNTRNFVAGAAAGFVTAMLWNDVFDKPLAIEGLVIGTAANLLLFYLIPAKPATQRQAA